MEDETSTSGAPLRDRVEDRVMLAEVAQNLFGALPTATTKIGRFVVLGQLGMGAMGVVFVAYDQKLGREVAIKLLRNPDSKTVADARLYREAGALAKLSHPNVVQVYDVGEHQGRVFIAMEYIKGTDLRAWLAGAPRTSKEVVEVFMQAGRGLAAAHARQLVHRDFKPANVILGEDGRACVADFGLVRSWLPEDEMLTVREEEREQTMRAVPAVPEHPVTETGMLPGTLAYMAPEQLGGGKADAQSDQFSFCVALYEGLYGGRPFAGSTRMALLTAIEQGALVSTHHRDVPRWLRAVVLRGLSADPSARFGSMDELTRALGANPAARRLRWAGAGTLAAVALGALLAKTSYDRHLRGVCTTQAAVIDQVWNEQARASVRSGLSGTGVVYANSVADKVMPWLDDQAVSWREQMSTVCLNATVDDTWSPSQLHKARWCLAQRKVEFAALVTTLADADEGVVRRAVHLASGLAPIAPCGNEALLANMHAPRPELEPQATEIRRDLTRAGYLRATGKYVQSLELAQSTLLRAEVLQWPALTASARAGEAASLGLVSRRKQAETAGLAAYSEAARCGNWGVAARAAIDLAYGVGVAQARPSEGKTWIEMAAIAIAYAGDPGELREAKRLRTLCHICIGAAEYEDARVYCESALSLEEHTLGVDHPALAAPMQSLGQLHEVAGRYAQAKALYVRVLASQERHLGPNHPDVGTALDNVGGINYVVGAYDVAKPLYLRALAIREQAFGLDDLDVARSVNNLGLLYGSVGDYAQAKASHQRVLEIRERKLGAHHPEVAMSLSNLANAFRGAEDFAGAKLRYQRALEILAKVVGPGHPDIATSLNNLGVVHARLKEYEQARKLQQRALEIYDEAFGPGHPKSAFPLTALGSVLVRVGEAQTAVALLERAVKIRVDKDAPGDLLASSKFRLAEALWDTPVQKGRDRGRARRLAVEARAGLAATRTPGQAGGWRLEEMDAWLRENTTQ